MGYKKWRVFEINNIDAFNAVKTHCKANNIEHHIYDEIIVVYCDTKETVEINSIINRATRGLFIGYAENINTGKCIMFWRDEIY